MGNMKLNFLLKPFKNLFYYTNNLYSKPNRRKFFPFFPQFFYILRWKWEQDSTLKKNKRNVQQKISAVEWKFTCLLYFIQTSYQTLLDFISLTRISNFYVYPRRQNIFISDISMLSQSEQGDEMFLWWCEC
jgi:hypothetical protein